MRLKFLTAIFLCIATTSVDARTVIDTTPLWNGTSTVGTFGFPNTANYAQVLTVPSGSDNVLQSFNLRVDLPANLFVRAMVYEWDEENNRPKGNPRYDSGPRSTTGRGMQAMNFVLPGSGVAFIPGSKIVLVLSALFDSSSGTGAVGFTGANVYAGGGFVFNNTLSASQLTTSSWTNYQPVPGGDLAFTATFDSIPGNARGVNINPLGLGQALIYPYYTTRIASGGLFNTSISLSNTTAVAKALKIRIMEARNGRPVLTFNLYLGAYDSWQGMIVPTDQAAALISNDASCTAPRLPSAGMQFTNAAYLGDGEGSSLDRTREGSIEIIEMGTMPADSVSNCSVLTDARIRANLLPGTGGISGTATLINVDTGLTFSYSPTILDNFNRNATLFTTAGSALPNLGSVSPKRSVFIDQDGQFVSSSWTQNDAQDSDPVTALLMVEQLLNEFTVDANDGSQTSWVVNFPTKHLYVTGSAAARPFANTPFRAGGACQEVASNIMTNRDGVLAQLETPITLPALCWQTGVINFGKENEVPNLLGSTLSTIINLPDDFTAGWLDLQFPNSRRMTDDNGRQYFGLPAIGLRLSTFTVNGFPYESSFNHKGVRRTQVPAQ